VTADRWKLELERRNILDPNAKNARARFSELRLQLLGRDTIGSRDELVWRMNTAEVF
jgi:hypothetical protein